MSHRLALSLLAIMAIVVTACVPIQPNASNSAEAILHLAVSNEPSTLDPHRTSELEAEGIFGNVCQPLFYYGIDLQEHPLLAESWEIAEDGLSMQLTLRQDVLFHDGTAFNAEAVKFTFDRLKQPESAVSPVFDAFQNVEIEVMDEYDLQFSFVEPNFNFITTLRNPYAVIVSPTAVATDEVAFGRKPICTGPFQIDTWDAGQQLLLTKNSSYLWAPEYYENQEAALIDGIQFRFVPDYQTQYLALRNGELDIMSIGVEEYGEVATSDQFVLHEYWIGGITYFGFNYQRSPMNELLVRQALSHAIDKETTVSTVMQGLAEPAFAPLAPSVEGFSEELQQFEYEYDPERSRALLTEAGFVDTDDDGIVERNGEPLVLEVLSPPAALYNQIFTMLQAQFREVGVETTLRAVPPSEISAITPTGEFDLLLYYYNWPYPSALSLFLSSERIGASNRVGYSNPEVDVLLQQISELPDDSPEKLALLFDAQAQILRDAPWQPLLAAKVVYAVNQRVENLRLHPRGGLLLHDISIEVE